MTDPWKTIICDDAACFFESVDENGKVREEFKIYPEMKSEKYIQRRVSKYW